MQFNYLKKGIKQLTNEEEAKLEKNLVWICAIERSGSTWLGRNLLSYNTKYLHEPELSEHLAVSTTLTDGRFMRRMDLRSKDNSYFFSDSYKNIWKFYLRKLILNRFHAEVGELSKKIIVKEAGTVDASDIISTCLPNSKLIMLIRDGRDIIDSGIDGRQKDGWMTKQLGTKPLEGVSRANFIKNRSKMWVALTENLLKTYKSHPENLRYLIKYEDLRKNTLEELEKIYKFLEIDISKDELQKIVSKFSYENLPDKEKGQGKFVRSASPGKWKENLHDEEKIIIEKIMGRMLEKLGYE